MDQNDSSRPRPAIIQLFMIKRFRQLVYAVVGFLLLGTLVTIWWNYALVRIAYDQTGLGKTITTKLLTTTETRQPKEAAVQRIFGLYLVPRQPAALISRAGDSETRTSVNGLPRIGLKTLRVTLAPLRAVQKVAADVPGCHLRNQFGTFHYRCTQADGIFAYNRPDNGYWAATEDKTFVTQNGLYPYKEGFVAVGYSQPDSSLDDYDPKLAYIIPGKREVAVMPLPADMRKAEDESTPPAVIAVTDATNRTNSGFALVNRTNGTVHYYSDFSSRSTQKTYKRKTKLALSATTSCTLRGTTLACLYGQGPESPDSSQEERLNDKIPNDIMEITDLTVAQPQPVVHTSSSKLGIRKLLTTSDGNFYIMGLNTLHLVKLGEKNFGSSPIAVNASNAVAGKSIYYTDDTGLYEYDGPSRSSVLRFASKLLFMSDVSAFGDDVIFSAFIKYDQSSKSHVYNLSSKDAPKLRKENLLPYSSSTTIPLRAMDYDDDRIYAQFAIPVTSDRQTGQTLPASPATLQAYQSRLTDRLRRDGLLTPTTKVVYTY